MVDRFFSDPRKRKRGSSNKANTNERRRPSTSTSTRAAKPGSTTRSKGKERRRKGRDDDEIEEGVGEGLEDDDDDDDGFGRRSEDEGVGTSEEEDNRETPAQKRLRLAQAYLDELKKGQELDETAIDAAEIDRDLISDRLQKDVLQTKGKLWLKLADQVIPSPLVIRTPTSSTSSPHRLTVTCAILSPSDGRTIYTSSKDGWLGMWRIVPFPSESPDPHHPPYKIQKISTFGKAAPSTLQPKARGTDPSRPQRTAPTVNPDSLREQAKGHHRRILTLDLSPDGKTLCSGGEERWVGVWDVEEAVKEGARASESRVGKVLAGGEAKGEGEMEVDGEEKAEEGEKNKVKVAPPRWVGALKGHKDSIAAVAFRKPISGGGPSAARMTSSTLYTSSFDRTIKLYDLSYPAPTSASERPKPQLAYLDTLFGHQDPILSLSTLGAETAVTAGGREKTCRWWKVVEETQLVFRGGVATGGKGKGKGKEGRDRLREVLEGGQVDEDEDEEEEGDDGKKTKRRKSAETRTGGSLEDKRFAEGSVECVAMVDDGHFLSGGDTGSVCLWALTKKKPVFIFPIAHGIDEQVSESEGTIGSPRWIVSIACLPYGDVFATGSWDGQIKLWKIDPSLRSFSPLQSIPSIPIPGFINSLQLIPSHLPHEAEGRKVDEGIVVVAGVGQEHRLGRWKKVQKVKNGAVVVFLPCRTGPGGLLGVDS